MMHKIGSWVSIAITATLLALVGWLLLPPAAPQSWPAPSPQSREAMAQAIAQAASRARAQGDHQSTYEAAQVLVESFPETSVAQRVAPHLERIRTAAQRHGLARKWSYTDLQSSGWGRITQASIAAEPSPLAPDVPSSYLVVRASTHQAHEALFLVPGVSLSQQCLAPSGCLVEVARPGAGRAPYRIVPERGQEGWWRFSDSGRMLQALLSPRGVEVFLPGVEASPLVFESQGLDASRVGVAAGQ